MKFKSSQLAKITITTLGLLATFLTPARAASEVKIGVITSISGPFKPYGDAYIDALNWGLKYYTNGKMAINGQKITLITKDDAANPDIALSSFKEFTSSGTKIIVGSANPNVATVLSSQAEQSRILFISGSAKNDAITSASNRFTFRSGNTATQDLAPLAGIRPISGRKIVLFVEDNNFGLGVIAAARAFMGSRGATFQELKVPASTSDFNTYAKQAAESKGSYILIAWSNGLTSGSMLQALKSQGAFVKLRPITGLGLASTYNSIGNYFEGTNSILIASCFPGVGKSKAAQSMAANFASAKKAQDLATCSGADAAKMIIRALSGNQELSTEKMISNLEGYSWVGVKGLMKINPTNHILVQPMFLVALKKSNNNYFPQLQKTIANVTG